VLGQVVAAVAGEPYIDVVRRNILAPLAMAATRFEGRRTPDEATVYQRVPRGAGPLLRAALPSGIVGARNGDWIGYRPFRLDGAAYGGLVGPIGDAARFLAAHLNDGAFGETRVLDATTAAQMRDITMPGRPYHLGLGWYQRPGAVTDPTPFVEHLGGGLGVYNTMRLYRDLDLGVLVMANSPGCDLEEVIAPVVAAAKAGVL
jgi:CubicO group peptidase (beta-lactamase class C family)